jgi:hypothetical protein
MFTIDQNVRLKTEEIGESIDRGVGRIVGFVPETPYLSVDFQIPETENLWLLPSEVIPVPPATRKHSLNIVDCFGIGYEVPSNEPDPRDDDGNGYGVHDYAPPSDEPLVFREF